MKAEDIELFAIAEKCHSDKTKNICIIFHFQMAQYYKSWVQLNYSGNLSSLKIDLYKLLLKFKGLSLHYSYYINCTTNSEIPIKYQWFLFSFGHEEN